MYYLTIFFHPPLLKANILPRFVPDTVTFQMREVVGHSKNHRRVRTYYGLHFKLMDVGKAKKFSWSKLLSEIVMKFGLFGVVSTILDLLWQIVFPMVGFPDYNDLVYKSVKVKEAETTRNNKETKECLELQKGEETKDKIENSLEHAET